MSSARVTVERCSNEDVRQRQVVVSLDGERWATLLYGDSATKDVAPGAHRLRFHNTLVWKTIDVDLAPGEQARFSVVNRAGPGSYWMLGLLGAGPLYLRVTREPEPPP